MLHGSVRQNIAIGRRGATEAEIERAARLAGAWEFIRELPDGLDTDVGERGRRLSGGQRQRLAIARALIADAPVLILDEPSTGLDAEAKSALLDPLRALMRDRTTVVISHDLLTTRDADLIAVLDGGRLVESGRHEDLVAGGGLYARLWALHLAGDPVRAGRLRVAPRGGRPVNVEPLAGGTMIAPGYEVIEHLSRGRRLDVYDVWSEERGCRCVVKSPAPRTRRASRPPASC